MLITNNINLGVNNTKKLAKPEASVKEATSFTANQQLAKLSLDNLQATFLGKAKKATKIDKNEFRQDTAENNKYWENKKHNIQRPIAETYEIKGNDIEKVVKTVKKQFQGEGLFESGKYSGAEKNYINWEKVGWENLKNEPLDWKNASNDELVAFYHSLALAETKDNPWVKKYNETNVPEPLSTYHVVVSPDAKAFNSSKLDLLNEIAAGKSTKYAKPDYLNQPIMKDGKLGLEFVVFDTETTGNRTNPAKGEVDKIVQLGAVRVMENGEVDTNTAVSQFVNPEMPIHPKAVEVHHITDERVKNEPVIEKVLRPFMDNFVKGQLLVAYNGHFDIPMLKRAVDSYNKISAKELNDVPEALNLDPYILMQRIHPFLGASKKLGNQYKWLFAKNMEGAHDALDDVKGTTDVLKYCCYYLQKHADRPLTVKDLLTFQHGGKVDGLNVKLNSRGYDASKSFRSSYRLDAITVKNFPNGFKIPGSSMSDGINFEMYSQKLLPLIGEENVNKLAAYKNKSVKKLSSLQDVLQFADLKPFDGKSVEQIVNVIAENSVSTVKEGVVEIWRKNIKSDHLHLGNDLPDLNVSRQIMEERAAQDAKAANSEGGRDLDSVLKDLKKA